MEKRFKKLLLRCNVMVQLSAVVQCVPRGLQVFKLGRALFYLSALFLFPYHEANAWFIFIPGALTEKIVNGLKGVDADMCVTSSMQEGGTLTSQSGSTALVKTISGPSSRCRNPSTPILASVVYKDVFATKAGLTIPDGYEQVHIPPERRFHGEALLLDHRSADAKMIMFSRKRTEKLDAEEAARMTGALLVSSLVDAKISGEEKIRIGDVPAYRFYVAGKSSGAFAKEYKLMVTVLDAEEEILTVNVRAPANLFDAHVAEFKKVIDSVTGVTPRRVAVTKTEPSAANTLPTSSGGTEQRAQTSAVEPKVPEINASASADLSPKENQVPSVNKSVVESASGSNQADGVNTSVAVRLRDLRKLYQDGIINREEYDEKRRELIKKL